MSQERVQAYLQRHRIGSLFEDMMTSLITATPEEPIPFLIRHLEGRQQQQQQKRTFPEESPRRDLAGFAALWAESSRLPESSPKGNPFRTYVTLCVDHTKKPRKSKSELAVSCLSPASSETRPMSQSLEPSSWDCSAAKKGEVAFTELQRLLLECQWLDRALREQTSGTIAEDTFGKVSDNGERSPAGATARPGVARGGAFPGDSGLDDDAGADLLAGEMLLLSTHKREDPGAADSGRRRAAASRGMRAQREEQKMRLAAMLTVPPGNGAPEEVTEHLDDAVELLEDEEDLRREGVSAPRRSGFRISRGRKPSSAEPQAKVTLNICSHCARLQRVDELRDDAETSLPGSASLIEKPVSRDLAEGTLKDEETQSSTSSTQLSPARPGPLSKDHQTGRCSFIRCTREGLRAGSFTRTKSRPAAAAQQQRASSSGGEQASGHDAITRSVSEPSRFVENPCHKPLSADTSRNTLLKAATEDAHRTAAAKVAAADSSLVSTDAHGKPSRPRLPSLLDKNHVLIVSTSWQQTRGATVPFYFGASFEKWL